eukprot:SAG31_NODE_1231_length_9212_cov_2.857566_9_plen_165_part_00
MLTVRSLGSQIVACNKHRQKQQVDRVIKAWGSGSWVHARLRTLTGPGPPGVAGQIDCPEPPGEMRPVALPLWILGWIYSGSGINPGAAHTSQPAGGRPPGYMNFGTGPLVFPSHSLHPVWQPLLNRPLFHSGCEVSIFPLHRLYSCACVHQLAFGCFRICYLNQ